MNTDYKEIEKLLDKYFEGETNLEEEKKLKDYFSQEDIPEHLTPYRIQFAYFKQSGEKELIPNNRAEQIEAWIQKQEKENLYESKPRLSKSTLPRYLFWTTGLAASILLFTLGYYLGRNTTEMHNGTTSNQDVMNEVSELKKMMMLTMLKQNSASERLKAVDFASEMESANPEVIDALIETLNRDENTNVRLAAANALFIYKENPKVKSAFIHSLQAQEDPIIQIALINILIAFKEKTVKKPIEEFLKKGEIPSQVKEKIMINLKNL